MSPSNTKSHLRLFVAIITCAVVLFGVHKSFEPKINVLQVRVLSNEELGYDIFYNTGNGYGASDSYRAPLSKKTEGEFGLITFDYPVDKVSSIRLDAPAKEGEYLIHSITLGQKYFGIPFIFDIRTITSQGLLKILIPRYHISGVSLKNNLYAIQVIGNDPIMEISDLQKLLGSSSYAQSNVVKYILYTCILLALLSYYVYYHTSLASRSRPATIVIGGARVVSFLFVSYIVLMVYLSKVGPYLFYKLVQLRGLFGLPEISDKEFAIGWIHFTGYNKSYDFIVTYIIIFSPIAVAFLIKIYQGIISDEK